MHPTPLDIRLLETLCRKSRVMAESQLVRLMNIHGVENAEAAKKRLAVLTKSGWLRNSVSLAQPLLTLSSPVLNWACGQSDPNFSQLAWTLEKRFRTGMVRTRIYFPSEHAVGIFGGTEKGRLRNVPQLSHDLHVSEIYLGFLTAAPDRIRQWVSGDELKSHAQKFQKIPDAVLTADDRQFLAIEFGGLYGPAKLEAFHTNMRERGLPYEIW